MMKITRAIMLTLPVAAVLCAGCEGGLFSGNPTDFIKPTIAVMKFDNRAPFLLGWDIGDSLGHQPGKTIGHVRVCRVHPQYSQAEIVLGQAAGFKVGQRCRRIENLAAK